MNYTLSRLFTPVNWCECREAVTDRFGRHPQMWPPVNCEYLLEASIVHGDVTKPTALSGCSLSGCSVRRRAALVGVFAPEQYLQVQQIQQIQQILGAPRSKYLLYLLHTLTEQIQTVSESKYQRPRVQNAVLHTFKKCAKSLVSAVWRPSPRFHGLRIPISVHKIRKSYKKPASYLDN